MSFYTHQLQSFLKSSAQEVGFLLRLAAASSLVSNRNSNRHSLALGTYGGLTHLRLATVFPVG